MMNNDYNLRECRKEKADMEEVLFLAQGRQNEFTLKQKDIYESLKLTGYILKTTDITKPKEWYGKVYGGVR